MFIRINIRPRCLPKTSPPDPVNTRLLLLIYLLPLHLAMRASIHSDQVESSIQQDLLPITASL